MPPSDATADGDARGAGGRVYKQVEISRGRMMRLCEFEMCTLLKDSVWEEFDRADVNGRSVAVCKICQRQVAANRGVMCMHFRTQHCKPADGPRHIDSLTSKPLCDKPRPFIPPTSNREICTDRCSQVWQRYLDSINNNNIEDGDACDTHSSSSAASDSKLRRRYRTLNMLRYLAAEPSDVAYASIIEGADDQIIKAIRGVGHAFIEGSLGDLSPVESLALGRYRKSIEGFADDANSIECTRKALLKPRKARGRVSGSAEYVPMLLTLALTRGGLETHVDDADESDVSSFTTADFEDSHDSSNDDSRHSSAGEDDSTEQSKQSDEDSEEDDYEEVEAEPEESEEGDDEEAEAEPEESEDAESEEDSDEESEDVESEEDSDEESEDVETDEDAEFEETEETEEDEDEEGEDSESEETEETEEDEDEEGEDSESEETEEDEDEGGEDSESDESEEDEESEDAQQPAKNLKRRHAEQRHAKNSKRGRY
jgi:hypothetical protein